MKKAITILAILAIVVSAVFADTVENHKIQIKTQVEGFEPVFQLYYDANTKTNYSRNEARVDADQEDGFAVVAEGEDFTNVTEANAYVTNSTIVDKTSVDISKKNVTATFTAKLTGNVKLADTTTYTIQFKADRLESDEGHKVGNAQAAAKYYINASVDESSIAAAQSVPAGVTMGNVTDPALSNNVLIGSIPATMDTSNIQPGDLASFTVTYEADEDAPVDYYTAYIWMVVSAS